MNLNALAARVGKLEEGSGDLPSGGLVVAWMKDGETEDEARERAMMRPELALLSKSQQRRLLVVLLREFDATLL